MKLPRKKKKKLLKKWTKEGQSLVERMTPFEDRWNIEMLRKQIQELNNIKWGL